jgi:RNA polymerase sigma factor (sigma-70 family)
MVPPDGTADRTDRQLLERFAASRDDTAFEALVHRHGPLVWGVCRRLLRHHQDAEDAFQATFLVLARKAGAIRRPELLANWLYGVACRTAARARADAGRRRAREHAAAVPAIVSPSSDIVWQDLRPVLDEEVQRLPAMYRAPFVLCYLEGRTNEEAARQIGCPKGTVLSRLTWARQWLRQRLERRGVTLAAGGVVALLEQPAAPASVSAQLVETTIRTVVVQETARSVAGGIIATGPAALAQGVLNQMILTQLKAVAGVVLLIGVVGVGALTYAGQRGGSQPASADPPDARNEGLALPLGKNPDMQLARLQLEAAIKDLIQVQADTRKVRAEITLAQAQEKKAAAPPKLPAIPDKGIEERIEQDPEVQQVRAQIAEQQKALHDLELVVARGKDNPLFQRETAALDELKKRLARRRQLLRPLLDDEIRAERKKVDDAQRADLQKQFQDKVNALQDRLTYLQELEKILDVDVRRLFLKARAQEPATEKRLRSMENEIQEMKASLEALRKK